ncbi:hypothetical protein AVEN_74547-1 [Araneus ventricosus]|uniref:Uncharacterized protein n=1 Tax=Araneus ventricosus TaxID=182803 RepID=A0A4Y2GPR7_ARAVE|nr:hypothetical protein AVEN_74547-1 [Araneus ventricosus]
MYGSNTTAPLRTRYQVYNNTFGTQVIGYGGCVECPPRSPALNSPDRIGLFSVGIHQTASVCNPSTNIAGTSNYIRTSIRNRITDACASVSPAMLHHVQREVQSRVQIYIVAEGHHFEHNR